MKKLFIIYNCISAVSLSITQSKQAEIRIDPNGNIFCHPYDKNLVPHFTFINNHIPVITTQNQETLQSTTQKHIEFPFKSYIQDIVQSLSEANSTIYDALSLKHILWATGLTFCATYAYIVLKIKNVETLIEDPNAWCNWKRELSAEKFFGQKELHLSEELINEIQSLYCDFKHPTDTTIPLQKFLKAYQHELLLCKSYFTLIRALSFLHCTRLFKINKEALDLKIKDRIERLAFIRTLLLNWITQHRTFNHTTNAA